MHIGRVGCPQNLQEFRSSNSRKFSLADLADGCPQIRWLVDIWALLSREKEINSTELGCFKTGAVQKRP